MSKKKIGYDDAYSLKTPEDSIKLYKKWAQGYDEDFALSSNYLSPAKICSFLINMQEILILQFLMLVLEPVWLVNV